jgi:ribosomal protein S18 acetylase RimI-like enzyme
MQSASFHTPLDQKGCLALAEALGDTPETCISVHRLRNGFCRVYVAGDPDHFDGAIVQDDFCTTEPMGFGSDPQVLWDLLRSVEGWDCVDVASECAAALGEIIEKETGIHVRYYGDIYHVLSRPAARFQNEAVRQLTLDDLELLESSPKELRGCCFGSTQRLLEEGFVACAILSGEVAAIAHTSARTDNYADIGVFTKEECRGRGFVTAAASIVAQRIQEAGLTPTWSTGEDNFASLRVAQKLGFTEVARRTYVILEKE